MITHLDLAYDKQKLLEEFESVSLIDYRPTRYRAETWFSTQDGWTTRTLNGECLEVERIRLELEELFGVPVIAKFFKLAENEAIPPHKDMGHRVCINIVLSDDPAPVKFKDGPEESYSCAMLNVFRRHEVIPGPERKMVKFQIGEKLFYDEALELWNSHK